MLPIFLAPLVAASFAPIRDRYVDRYFAAYPTAATQAGRHEHDRELEDWSPARRRRWLDENRRTLAAIDAWERASPGTADDRLDAEALAAQVRREIHDFAVRRRPDRDPLWWTEPIGNATVFLLIRDDRPARERLSAAAARATLLPRLAGEAENALSAAPPGEIAPELCSIAASQVRASAAFYREGFPRVDASDAALSRSGARAAAALERFAAFLDGLGRKATGSPRLGKDYAETFRLGTGIAEPIENVLADAERDLAAKRVEAAAYGRTIWKSYFPDSAPPPDDRELLRRLFSRAADDHAPTVESFVAQYRARVVELERYLRERKIVTLPDPLTIWTDRSPAFFVGQSVGGIYAAGPWEPDAKTLWFLPTPPEGATAAEREAFFRDFNDHFNAMITPHETLPGHYLQLKFAARHPRKVRAIFADGVFVEGWGTFCERLMLDEGWGGPLDRVAHLKKQMENIARTIADIRVHTKGTSREELTRFLRDDAVQDAQFSSNMWTRAITSAPQLTFYYLGYREVRGLFDDVRRARGPAFRLRDFMDAMMEDGPVPVAHYREKMLGKR
ncbi:MAG TPA: DUF885 domain-containing protein [Thermoanaerobaculia bacterium]|nr:DUF885 domain-containing protein [Thermoanaerobaculia bacterium]